MSLDQGIRHGKEHRKPYWKSKAFDKMCRNHGACGWCRLNRTYSLRKLFDKLRFDVEDAKEKPPESG